MPYGIVKLFVVVNASFKRCVDVPPKSLRNPFFNWFVFNPQTSASAMMIINVFRIVGSQ